LIEKTNENEDERWRERGTNVELEYKPLIVGGSGFIDTEGRGSVESTMNMVSEQSSE